MADRFHLKFHSRAEWVAALECFRDDDGPFEANSHQQTIVTGNLSSALHALQCASKWRNNSEETA